MWKSFIHSYFNALWFIKPQSYPGYFQQKQDGVWEPMFTDDTKDLKDQINDTQIKWDHRKYYLDPSKHT